MTTNQKQTHPYHHTRKHVALRGGPLDGCTAALTDDTADARSWPTAGGSYVDHGQHWDWESA